MAKAPTTAGPEQLMLTMKSAVTMPFSELRKYSYAESRDLLDILRAGYRVAFEIRARRFAEHPGSWGELEDAMYSWQHIACNVHVKGGGEHGA